MSTSTRLCAVFGFLLAMIGLTVIDPRLEADEGMWTFANPPVAQVRDTYGFSITQPWLDHLRLSSVRFDNGGSGSFVSPRGLVLTNHHVAADQLQKLSTPQKNYLAEGFLARTATEELKCSDLELNVLMSMENVTLARATLNSCVGARRADARRAKEGRRGHRAGEHVDDGPPLGRRFAVSIERVLAVPLQAIYRRPARLRARAVDRLLRGRRRQLHLPSLRPGRRALPRVRERRARLDSRLSEMVRQRCRRRRSGLRFGPPWFHGPAGYGHRARNRSGPGPSRGHQCHNAGGSASSRSTGPRAPNRRGRQPTRSSGSAMRSRRTPENTRG